MTDKKVKILATLGPKSNSPQVIGQLLKAGADGFRLNFSHGDHSIHSATLAAIEKASRETGIQPAILADLQGPKIRTGRTPENASILLRKGTSVLLTTDRVEGGDTIIPIEYPPLLNDIHAGHEILLNDGTVRIRITGTDPRRNGLKGEVLNDGVYSSRKGVNFPNIPLTVPSFTAKDRKDLAFILENEIHYIALSFVRTPEDLKPVTRAAAKSQRQPRVIAKIEKPEAAANIDAIVDACDGIMVARGDLGVEMPIAGVPVTQKLLVAAANRKGKQVIVATQMLESMISNPGPTRAEATDVANAVLDGTDVVMLSGETAVGAYPVETVSTMAQIASHAEKSAFFASGMVDLAVGGHNPPHAVCEAAVWASRDLGNAPVILFTVSGATAIYVSKIRCQAPIFAFSPEVCVVRALNLAWNVQGFVLPLEKDIVSLQRRAEGLLVEKKLLKKGQTIVVVSGTTPAKGATNFLRVKQVGED